MAAYAKDMAGAKGVGNSQVSRFCVLEAITPSRIGGAEVYAADICEGLAHLGSEVELFCPTGRPFVDYAANRGLSCHSWKTHGKLDPITILKLARLIRDRHANVVHTHLSTASLLGAFAARLAGVPAVAHVHGLNSAACFKYSTAVIAVSQAAKDHLCAQGLREDRVRVVHNGVDLAKFSPIPPDQARRELGIDARAELIGVFGRLSKEKGQAVALQAMAPLSKIRPNARMLIVGDGKDRAELVSLANSLGISERVRFEPFNPDIRPMISACDIVLVPSLKEGFGLVAVNAMALHRPVIATNVGGLPEIIKDGETGVLVPPGEPEPISRVLSELLADPERMEIMGRLGRKRAEDRFDLDRQIGLVLEVLKEVVG